MSKAMLTDLQARTLRALYEKAGRYTRFTSAKMNRCAARLSDRGFTIGLSVDDGATRYQITDKGCEVIGKSFPEKQRFAAKISIELDATSADQAATLIRDALSGSVDLMLANASALISKARAADRQGE